MTTVDEMSARLSSIEETQRDILEGQIEILQLLAVLIGSGTDDGDSDSDDDEAGNDGETWNGESLEAQHQRFKRDAE